MTHLKVHRSLLTGKRVVTRRLAVGVRQILVENGNVARQLAISRLEPPRRVNWTHASSLDSRVRSRLAMKLLVGTRTAAVHPRCPNPTFVASVTLILFHYTRDQTIVRAKNDDFHTRSIFHVKRIIPASIGNRRIASL